MSAIERVWVEHWDAQLRRDIVERLERAALPVVGSSSGLQSVADQPDVAVLLFDVERTDIDRATAVARARGIRLIGLVPEPSADRRRELRRVGVCALLGTNTLTTARLVACVQAVQRLPAPPRRRPTGEEPHRGQRCTPREVEVLRLLADGASTREVAERLSYSERTVKTIVHDLLEKLHARTRAHAVALAARRGVI